MIKKIFKKKTKNIFLEQFLAFKAASKDHRFKIDEVDLHPCLDDNTSETKFDAHYIYHPAWAARILKSTNPKKHVDISSTLHFCSIISAFIPIDFYDFRPAPLSLDNLNSNRCDITKLDFEDNSIESISCMHTIEHIGLGRYGDPIDVDGDLKAFNELKRVCAKNGNLLVVVPVGNQKIAFNAHRIYNPNSIISYMDGFDLQDFSLVTDSNAFISNADLNFAETQNYACGCFWFVKS
ncbi:DUF268 domain-containing protein [Pedobacter frigidisoli]|uniref:DUF268 domain-containing protein n=1 Tax=Pedobacter frigidisoli TaxID=2530455 RepID=UPI00292F0B18|nr:DUF268 domain-containing protein [Pedobacter frigidisoli]